MIKPFGRVVLGTLLLATSGLLHAGPIYTFSDLAPDQNRSGGELSDLSTTFDTNHDLFTWSYTVEDRNNREHNGFWLVVNDGPTNPKGDKNLAILYGDLVNGDISAYAYDGVNGSGSWEHQPFLGFFEDVIQVSAAGTSGSGNAIRDVTFTIDVGDINGLNQPGAVNPLGQTVALGTPWEGVSYDDKLGIWFHSTASNDGSAPAVFRSNGTIESFSYDSQGWIDTGVLDTTNIPEPGVLHLSALGLIAFGASRRFARRNKVS